VLLGLENVSIGPDDGPRLEGVNWTINEGEHWAILGENGSGKNLLIDALTRRVPLSSGSIRTCFHSGPAPFSRAGQVAVVTFGSCGAAARRRLPYLQARWESAELALAPVARSLLSDGSGIETAQSTDILARFGLREVLDRPIISLSSGEFRKLMLVDALLKKPKLLVIEEPFAGLDRESAAEFRQLLEEQCRSRVPCLILFLSRPWDLPEGVSHLICVQSHRIAAIGPRAKVQNSKAFSASLVAAGKPDSRIPMPGKERHLKGLGSNPIIEMTKVSVRYDGHPILEDITWSVNEGEHWAILGPNGAGKSTLLSLVLADNPQAYANDIRLFGRRRGSGESIWDIKRKIGWVSPELQFCYPGEATALEVVCSGLFDSIGLYRNASRQDVERAMDWIERLAVSDLADRTFWSLSAGEQRLVLLARALVKEPPLLVLDEPCLGLDLAHVGRFIDKLEQLSAIRDTTLLYVSHRAEELPSTITHILRLDRGRIVEG